MSAPRNIGHAKPHFTNHSGTVCTDQPRYGCLSVCRRNHRREGFINALGCLLFMAAVLTLLSVKDCGDWEVLEPSNVGNGS